MGNYIRIEGMMRMAETAWSLVPPVVTIILALATKEVYMSLAIGIFIGALMFTGFSPLLAVDTMFGIMSDKVGGNVYILVFLVLLGIMVSAIQKSGASQAYGDYAARKISGRRGALLVTVFLGILIFIDDYFNCLTVGTVMRPVTDRFKVTRAKLAYIIDATAAPICIIAPVSSWAAAVTSSLPEDSGIDGFGLFLQTIPFNLYAWLTLIFMFFIIFMDRDFSRMAVFEKQSGSTLVIPSEYQEDKADQPIGNGRIIDLVLPLIVLIGGCVFGMLYTGGILEGKGIADSFADCDSSHGLVIGSFISLIATFLLYIPRRVLTFRSFCDCFVTGFKQMTSAIMILCLAWTLSGVCGTDYLNIGGYVGSVVADNATVATLLPAVFFLVAIGLAFSTGTSWGTFGILIPIVLAIIGTDAENMHLMVMTVAAVLAGAVGGDHVSPISDTTILASAGAQCHHIDHVSTQIPYVMTVASCCFVGYLVDGITGNGLLGNLVAVAMLLCIMIYLYKFKHHYEY